MLAVGVELENCVDARRKSVPVPGSQRISVAAAGLLEHTSATESGLLRGVVRRPTVHNHKSCIGHGAMSSLQDGSNSGPFIAGRN